jgi:hypothetical protein
MMKDEDAVIRAEEEAESSIQNIIRLCEDLDGTDPHCDDIREDIIADLHKAVKHLDACNALLQEAIQSVRRTDPFVYTKEGEELLP